MSNRIKKHISLAVSQISECASGLDKRIKLLQYASAAQDVLRWSAFREATAAYSRALFIGCRHPRSIRGITCTIMGLFVIDNELITSWSSKRAFAIRDTVKRDLLVETARWIDELVALLNLCRWINSPVMRLCFWNCVRQQLCESIIEGLDAVAW